MCNVIVCYSTFKVSFCESIRPEAAVNQLNTDFRTKVDMLGQEKQTSSMD